MKLFAVMLAAIAAFAATTQTVIAEEPELEKWDAERRETMASKKYERQCRKYAERFGVEQTAAAQIGEEPKILCRFPPQYPGKCMRGAPDESYVDLVFDVSPDGYTFNIRHSGSNNECLIVPAASAVMLWQYESSADGATNLQETLTFRLN
ncbi:hypothetical protein [Hyphococcus sp.]|uniref:hypothetical protein n=1 Tax=Hyphococcus sp. TaxID=2038636 RepID=UPI003CCBAFB7